MDFPTKKGLFFPLLFLILVILVSPSSSNEVATFTGPGTGSGRPSGMWAKINSRFAPLNRRMDCSVLCRRTGFTGFVGGCQCGFTLFTKKSVTPVRYPSLADSDEDFDSHQPLSSFYRTFPAVVSSPHNLNLPPLINPSFLNGHQEVRSFSSRSSEQQQQPKQMDQHQERQLKDASQDSSQMDSYPLNEKFPF